MRGLVRHPCLELQRKVPKEWLGQWRFLGFEVSREPISHEDLVIVGENGLFLVQYFVDVR